MEPRGTGAASDKNGQRGFRGAIKHRCDVLTSFDSLRSTSCDGFGVSGEENIGCEEME